jgi:hypothetical protein
MFNLASMNSISSMPSPVYHCRKALHRKVAVNCSDTRFHTSCTAVELPMKVVDILRPLGGMLQMDALTLLGIHSTKYELVGDPLLFTMLSICSSTSLVDAAAEHARAGQVAAVAGVGVEPLLGQLGHGQGAVLLRAAADQGREADHEEVHRVHRQLAQVAVQLACTSRKRAHTTTVSVDHPEPEAVGRSMGRTGEAQGAGGSADGGRHEVVEVAVGGGGLERAEADVVQGLVCRG